MNLKINIVLNVEINKKTIKIKEEKEDEEAVESPMDRVCPKCGKIALDEEAFCTNCGTKI